jgi:hypothetical protein
VAHQDQEREQRRADRRLELARPPPRGDRERQAHRERGETHHARGREHREPHRAAEQPDPRIDRDERSAAGRYALPALEAQPHGEAVAEHRRGTARHSQNARPALACEEAREHCDARPALQEIEREHRQPDRLARRAHRVRRADVAAADLAQVLAFEDADEHPTERDRPDEVRAQDGGSREQHREHASVAT